MKAILFQGNPGRPYQKTRHNAGFIVADFVALRAGAKWKTSSKFGAQITEVDDAILVKPESFYNETGLVARRVMDFYKLDPSSDLLVVADDLNLPFGTLKTRLGGSDGGNNGLKSISAVVGADYARLRIGTDNDQRAKTGDTDFVLSKFSEAEWAKLPEILHACEQIVLDFASDEFSPTTVVL